MANKLKQWQDGKAYRAKLNLLGKVHREIEPLLEASRKADDLLDRCTRQSNGVDNQGYSNLPGCSRLDVYTMGNAKGSESLVSPDSFEACAIAGMVRAEDNSRNIADNN